MIHFIRKIKKDQQGGGLLIMIMVSTLLAAAAYYLLGISTNAIKEASIVRRQGEIADLEKYIRNNMNCFQTLNKNSGNPLFFYNKSEGLLINRHSVYTDSMVFYQWLINIESYNPSTRTYNVRVADVKTPTKWIKLFKTDPLECN